MSAISVHLLPTYFVIRNACFLSALATKGRGLSLPSIINWYHEQLPNPSQAFLLIALKAKEAHF